MYWSCVFCFFPPWSDDQITNSAYSGTRNGSIYASLHLLHISRRYAWLCFQKDRFHSADATTISEGSFRRDLWMSLYEAYFVWLPTVYFQCAVCAHLCLDLRSLCCGWLWDECSPRLLGSRKPSTCRSSRMYQATCGLEWWVRVYLYPFGGRCRWKPTVLRCSDRSWTSFAKLRLINLNSHTWSAYLPAWFIILSAQTSRQEIKGRHCIYIWKRNFVTWWTAQVEAIGRKK